MALVTNCCMPNSMEPPPRSFKFAAVVMMDPLASLEKAETIFSDVSEFVPSFSMLPAESMAAFRKSLMASEYWMIDIPASPANVDPCNNDLFKVAM